MKAFKYTLDKSSRKFICPECNKKSFVKFIDIERNYIDGKYGRCDREDRCGYFLKPNDADDYVFVPRVFVENKPPSFIPSNYAIKTFRDYEENNLIKFLVAKFGYDKVMAAIELYKIGIDDTSSFTKDWVVFWQFDKDNNIRSGKMIKYGSNGKRSKDVSSTWFHKKKSAGKDMFPDFNLKQCLFGEHLINKFNKPIAIVESEKTAIIASMFIDKYLWLAVGGLNELRAEKLLLLKNRSVTLFPDLGCFGRPGDYYRDNDTNLFFIRGKIGWLKTKDIPVTFKTGNGPPLSSYQKWQIKAKQFGFNISDHIEKIANVDDRNNGYDIADFLLR